MTGTTGVAPEAHVAALAALPGIGPRQLTELLDRLGPAEAWAAVRDGREVRPPRGSRPAVEPWRDAAARVEPAARWATLAAAGIGVTWAGQPTWPATLVDEPQPPGALFWRGDLGALRRPAVAVVGTRHATAEGRAVAYELGRDLAGRGVAVVSGLALGIDGAAHAGVLAAGDGHAPPVGVAASGVDAPYPKRHTALWGRVIDAGIIISETPPGGAATTWRFPWRNRLIVALADLVVVVESRDRGGSLLTVEAALARGVDLGAVPGPVHSPVSAGTNQLLVDGAAPIRHAGDVLDALGLVGARPGGAGAEQLTLVVGEARAVLDAVGWSPTSVGRVVERSGMPLAVVARHLDQLHGQALVTEEAGRWSRT